MEKNNSPIVIENITTNKKILLIVFLILSLIVIIGLFLYSYYRPISNSIVVKDNGAESINTISSSNGFKKISYIGFQKKGQPFWIELGKYIEDAALLRGVFYTDLTPDYASFDDEVTSLKTAINQGVDGIILGTGFPSKMETVLSQVNKTQIPIITVNETVDHPSVKGFVTTDNYSGARLAGDYIVDKTKGKGTVLIVCGASDNLAGNRREAGVRDVVEKAGMKVIVRYSDWQIEKAYQIAKEELGKINNIKAVFGCFDPGIISVEKVVEELKLQGQIILVGFDGIQEAYQMILDGKLSATVSQPIKQMGRESIEMIIDYLNKKQMVRERSIPGMLIDKNNVGYFIN